MGRGGGSRAAGAIAHMEMGEVFKTAGFRRARGRARGSCGDADRDDARRAVLTDPLRSLWRPTAEAL